MMCLKEPHTQSHRGLQEITQYHFTAEMDLLFGMEEHQK